MDKQLSDDLPTYRDATAPSSMPLPTWINRRRRRRDFRVLATACLVFLAISAYRIANNTRKSTSTLSIERLHQDHAVCATLRREPAQVSTARDHNKRWVKGTKPLLIRNATIWTGEPAAGTSESDARAGKGWSWISSDIFVDKGLIVEIRPSIALKSLPSDTSIFEAHGRLLTAGIVDMHSHAGLSSEGGLQDDTNEMSSDITPYVRSIDGVDPLQPEMEYIKSGGVTTSLFLPGSGNNMGGEAFVLKFAVGKKNGREEISQQDLYADPDRNWRYMKMACGENPKRVYGKVGEHGPVSRLGEAWEFRHALEQAQQYVREQDDWCTSADARGAENMATYLKQDLRWESLGAVLRGQVRINTHCYTIPDLEAFVRHTNEFKFRVYAFHHAHQTYLVPEVLKRAWGGTPAAALFADNMYYKVEAYTASERAGAILYAHNITPTYVSDNPVLNSQHVVFEAAKAYGNGLPYHAALAGVTSAPADLLGLGDRIGKIKAGFDADIVVWDSDPLTVGAAPVQVWIDGAAQFKDPYELKKSDVEPITPNPGLASELEMSSVSGSIVFSGISYAYPGIAKGKSTQEQHVDNMSAVFHNGKLVCLGTCTGEIEAARSANALVVQLRNGHVTPPLTAFSTTLGLAEIDAEPDTHDGPPPSDGITRAIDGLLFGGKQLAHAYSHGVTRAISAPNEYGFQAKGVSAGFRTGAKHVLEDNAVWADEVGLHYVLTLAAKDETTVSVSAAISNLRGKLLDAINDNTTVTDIPTKDGYAEKAYLKRVINGTLPLVLAAHSADTIASIIRLKSTIEHAILKATPSSSQPDLHVVVIGAAEAHLVATELAAAKIPVILAPLQPHQGSWDQKRCLTGAPLTNGTTINWLLDAGVLVGLSVEETWETRDLGLLAGIAYANSEERLNLNQALDLVGRNVYKALGIEVNVSGGEEWVVWEGSPLEIGGRIRAISGLSGQIDVWQ
ncbi:uncharacterized protein CC84DRAFT_1126831 [Paraphaeosphaeria sporulosa]|uniref:Amidohydrolase 3 domain-containing protein n=1 Tax=Paraphaeosphaeria sporulosa TaxID=1460663 RepID=A0A177C6T2_9PLEO|nr:uncharacterized protein CC84DRAFT_1126831 [Paraphaeosphaeria sporulosa]OAG02488.1 hypothetical protein CC84DRAFT_1126831 [Paraphaeosphaeria sporulosa]